MPNTVVICDRGQVNSEDDQDPFLQRETAIIAQAHGANACDMTLGGMWIDSGASFGQSHLAITFSCDGGEDWYAPTSAPCPPAAPNSQSFFNDPFFIGDCPGDPPACLPPFNCATPPTEVDVTAWSLWDPEFAVGGNGAIYCVGTASVPVKHPAFARTFDQGQTFDVFGNGRKIKYICESLEGGNDQPSVAASPDPASNDVYIVSWGTNEGIQVVRSTDAGDTFGAPDVVGESTLSGGLQNAARAARSAMSSDGYYYVVWEQAQLILPPGPPNESHILMRRFNEVDDWYPALPTDPQDVSGPYFGWSNQGGGRGLMSGLTPSIAVDISGGARQGWVYVVWSERGDITAAEARVKFARSCDNGQTWSAPCAIAPDSSSLRSLQIHPQVRVDGRGNVGVSWYDTRFDDYDGSVESNAKFDIYFAYSTDGGSSWSEQRVSAPMPDGLPSFVAGDTDDYSGMTADPRVGESRFYLLTMGRPRGVTPLDQDIYAYEITVAAKGDMDGDYDIDGNDSGFNACWGNTWTPFGCKCALLDFDDDGSVYWDDIDAFMLAYTDPLCECHGPCQLIADPACEGESGSAGESTFSAPLDIPSGEGCDRAAWYYSTYGAESLCEFVSTLDTFLAENPDHPEAEATIQFLDCARFAQQ